MPDFRPFTLEDAVAAASAVLSDAWGRQVMIEAVRSLGEAERRNIVLRAQAVQDGAAPRSIIIKATRAASYDPQAVNAYEASGFVKEWAATSYLARHASAGKFTPALLAADRKQGVLVYSDLGEGLSSLVGPLLHGTADEAERALIAYAEALAALHRATIGCRDAHCAILGEGFAAAYIPPPAHRWIETVARVPHTLLGGDFPEDEMGLILHHLRQPGCWQALVHGDPCPDNVLLQADRRALLIDFEFARPGHALLDAAYWRMGFPTCWCAGTIPAAVRHRIDHAYRAAIADVVPAARDDDTFRRESAIIDAAWLLGSLAWLLQDALSDDATWGRATNRSRIITYLQLAIRSAEEADILPRLRKLAAVWQDDLRSRWPDTAILSDFPAFTKDLSGRPDI
jgi:aminoglycoside phosphotransferase (APT) family kinase protein